MIDTAEMSPETTHIYAEIRDENTNPIALIVDEGRDYPEFAPRFDITIDKYPVVFHCVWPDLDIRKTLRFSLQGYTDAVEKSLDAALEKVRDDLDGQPLSR